MPNPRSPAAFPPRVTARISGFSRAPLTDETEVVVIGGHLDSWDLGTGAIDDGAGIAITMATGALLKPMK